MVIYKESTEGAFCCLSRVLRPLISCDQVLQHALSKRAEWSKAELAKASASDQEIPKRLHAIAEGAQQVSTSLPVLAVVSNIAKVKLSHELTNSSIYLADSFHKL